MSVEAHLKQVIYGCSSILGEQVYLLPEEQLVIEIPWALKRQTLYIYIPMSTSENHDWDN